MFLEFFLIVEGGGNQILVLSADILFLWKEEILYETPSFVLIFFSGLGWVGGVC